MRILVIVPNPPSPVRVRPFQFVRTLRARGHDVTVACPYAGESERRDLEALGAMGVPTLSARVAPPRRIANLAAALLAGLPLQARFAWSPALARRAEDAVTRAGTAGRDFDIAHVEHLRGSEYGLRIRTRLPVVWDSVDCISSLFEQTRRSCRSARGRAMATFELARTRRREAWLRTQFDRLIVTSEADRQSLLTLPGEAHARGVGAGPTPGAVAVAAVVPNGVDLDAFRPADQARRSDAVVMTGKMSYHANVTAARFLVDDVMPVVWAHRPSTRVVIAGAAPTREVRSLAARHPARVEVTGWVADLAECLQRAAVAVAPVVYGVGTQNKVLEAMATATAVVATPQAASSLSACPGRDLVVARDAAEMAAAIVGLLDQPERSARIGAAGRAYVERHHRWEGAVDMLESVYAEAIRDAGTARGWRDGGDVT